MKASNVMVIPRRMHRSPAFRKLSATSTFVLFEFLYRRKMTQIPAKSGRSKEWVISNNGELIFTYAEAEKNFNISRSTFCRSIDQLVQLGFIDIAHHGGGMMKDCSKYGISDRWESYGKKEFIDKKRPKDTRELGFKSGDKWEKTAGRKRKDKTKTSITCDTRTGITDDTSEPCKPASPSITDATHQLTLKPKYIKDLRLLEAMYPSQYH